MRRLFAPPPPPRPSGAAPSPHEWSIGIYVGESPLDLRSPEAIANPVLTRTDISDVPAKFVADPFMLMTDGTWYMFFEVLHARRGRGEIGLATSADGFRWNYERIVLAEDFHLSYPYVFEWDHEYYMIPESYQAGGVRLYRARRFPTEWRYVKRLLRGPFFADSSVFFWQERWWMFTETNSSFKSDTLRLYHAERLKGPWREHPSSPVVKNDGHIARPAGRVLVDKDGIIRYAQDCDPVYGTRVRAFRVTELTTTRYEETPLRETPVLQAGGERWNRCGMHHLDAHLLQDGRWLACVDGWFSVDSQGAGTTAASEAATR